MRTAIIVPARFQSNRFPGKPLVPLTGATGIASSLIIRSWRAACAVPGVARVIVATDDVRIAEHAAAAGADVAMTSPEAANGTARCAEVALRLPDIDLIVNLQGDALLTPPEFVTALIDHMRNSPADMATPVIACDTESLAMMIEDRFAGRIGATTAVFSATGRALYFSKEIIPHLGAEPDPNAGIVYHHLGLYAYRPAALAAYAGWPIGRLERLEGLEQLRFLEHDCRVDCVQVQAKGRVFWEVNNPEDVDRIQAVLRRNGQP